MTLRRPLQREIILTTLARHDVFVSAATSFGKSLCYQLPAVLDHGITICVSPLLALMQSQVDALRAASIPVECLRGATTFAERDRIFADLECGHPRTRLLYVTPEYCQTQTFRKHVRTVYHQRELARIAVDEAHCVSEWGHEFRPAFLQLRFFREECPGVPIICLTATATSKVRTDIIKELALDPTTLRIFTAPTTRPNLHFEIQYYCDEHDDRFERLVAMIKAAHQRRAKDPTRRAELDATHERPDDLPGIVYAGYRRECDDVAAALRARDIGAQPYHAGLSKSEREKTQTRWQAGHPGYGIVVATAAFGMGIDKGNVRFVVHWTLPKSFEAYYQEAGRAGRDCRAARCVLFYSREDCARTEHRLARDADEGGPKVDAAVKAKRLGVKMESLKALVAFCERTSRCRHEMITEYFGDNPDAAECDSACDRCKEGKSLKERKEKGLATEDFVASQAWAPKEHVDQA